MQISQINESILRFQSLLGADLSGVNVQYVRHRSLGNDKLGATIGNRIFLDESYASESFTTQQRILAHELVHVIQKRLGSFSSRQHTTIELEAEAYTVGSCVSSGNRCQVRLADSENTSRYWGEDGHYYTAYLIMLLAGVGDEDAREMAFYAQMADEVCELDAIDLAKEVGWARLRPRFGDSDERVARKCKEAEIIHRGLHSLTGRASKQETRIRQEILQKAPFPSFTFGLAIHPYGDSFSHRRYSSDYEEYLRIMGKCEILEESERRARANRRPFHHPMPHCRAMGSAMKDRVKRIGAERSSGSSTGRRPTLRPSEHHSRKMTNPIVGHLNPFLGNQGRESDTIDLRPELYKDYAIGLFKVVRNRVATNEVWGRVVETSQHGFQPETTDSVSIPKQVNFDIESIVSEISKLESQKERIGKIRSLAKELTGVTMSIYEPEEFDTMPWILFQACMQIYNPSLTKNLFSKARRLAEQWAI